MSKLGYSDPFLLPPPYLLLPRIEIELNRHLTHIIMSEFKLAAARYGKDEVRVFRVIKPSNPGGQHQVVEYNVCLLLEGDIETRWVSFL